MCRTGLEDNVRLDKTTLASSNAELVQRVAEPLRGVRQTAGHGAEARDDAEAAACRLSVVKRVRG